MIILVAFEWHFVGAALFLALMDFASSPQMSRQEPTE